MSVALPASSRSAAVIAAIHIAELCPITMVRRSAVP
jgi:hypothetical protein